MDDGSSPNLFRSGESWCNIFSRTCLVLLGVWPKRGQLYHLQGHQRQLLHRLRRGKGWYFYGKGVYFGKKRAPNSIRNLLPEGRRVIVPLLFLRNLMILINNNKHYNGIGRDVIYIIHLHPVKYK